MEENQRQEQRRQMNNGSSCSPSNIARGTSSPTPFHLVRLRCKPYRSRQHEAHSFGMPQPHPTTWDAKATPSGHTRSTMRQSQGRQRKSRAWKNKRWGRHVKKFGTIKVWTRDGERIDLSPMRRNGCKWKLDGCGPLFHPCASDTRIPNNFSTYKLGNTMEASPDTRLLPNVVRYTWSVRSFISFRTMNNFRNVLPCYGQKCKSNSILHRALLFSIPSNSRIELSVQYDF